MPNSSDRASSVDFICSKCSSPRMRFVGRSVSGVGYFRCDDCEHLIVDTPADTQ
jgi:DNA-directed RNA polymerase subunit RPC12/RpoP